MCIWRLLFIQVLSIQLSLMLNFFMNDKGITSGYGGRMKVACIHNNKRITLLHVVGCKVNDKKKPYRKFND